MSGRARAVTVVCEYCERRTLRHRRECPYCSAPLPVDVRPVPRVTVKMKAKARPMVKRIERPSLPTLSQRSNAFVYLISDGTYCKIGYARDLVQRLTILQGASPRDLIVLAATETPQFREVEHALHGLFAKKHVRREWYKAINLDEWSAAISVALGCVSHDTPAPAASDNSPYV